MLYLLVKAAISAVIIVAVSEIAKRSPAAGAVVASLPLISILAMIWLWRDTSDAVRIADHAQATLWYVLPSLPLFLILPALLRQGWSFWAALALGCAVTVALYLAMVLIGPRIGIRF